MKVLITGSAGFLGSHLVDYFLNEGHEVYGIDNFVTGNQRNLENAMSFTRFTFQEFNLIEGLPANLPRMDAILHFACPASPKDYLEHPELTLKVDSVGTFHVLEKARLDGSRFIMASTSEVYGDPLAHPQQEEYWGNVNPTGPRSVYDEAKRFSEAATMCFHRDYGVDARIVRIFNTYGPRMRLNDGRVVPNFITQALSGEALTVYGDGSQTRSFCYVDDLVRAVYGYTLLDEIEYRIINLGNPDEYQIVDFARIVADAVSVNFKATHVNLPVDDPKQRRPDISRARQVLGWEPTTPLEMGLEKTIEYFRNLIFEN